MAVSPAADNSGSLPKTKPQLATVWLVPPEFSGPGSWGDSEHLTATASSACLVRHRDPRCSNSIFPPNLHATVLFPED